MQLVFQKCFVFLLDHFDPKFAKCSNLVPGWSILFLKISIFRPDFKKVSYIPVGVRIAKILMDSVLVSDYVKMTHLHLAKEISGYDMSLC